MGDEPLLDFLGVVDLGIINHNREVIEERRGMRPLERLGVPRVTVKKTSLSGAGWPA